MNDPETGQQLWRLRELVPFVAAIIAGAVGGCTAATIHASSRPREVYAAYIAAYSIVGIFGSVLSLAGAMVFYPHMVDGWSKLILLGCISGFIAPLSLLGTNVTMRFVLQKIGLEVTVDVKRSEKDGG